MTFGKSFTQKHLSLTLFASILAACGADTPAFQEKAMSQIGQQSSASTFSPESADNSADATVMSAEGAVGGDNAVFETASLPEIDASRALSELGLDSELSIDVQESQLRFGSQTTSISSSLDGEQANDVVYTILAPSGKDPGKIINGNTYESPSAGTEAYEVKIIAVSKNNPAQVSSKVLKLEPATQVFAGCTQDLKGFPIKADVYALAEDTVRLPDFTLFAQSTATACMEAFQIKNRAWSDGFPGQPGLIEWFAIRASSNLTVSTSGKHYFKLNADDGAKLYIDGQLVVDNDGLHAEKAVTGSINLNAGPHEIVMEYFQGPRYHIALELFWKIPGTSSYAYVPAIAFKP
jgi:hypothetical protein